MKALKVYPVGLAILGVAGFVNPALASSAQQCAQLQNTELFNGKITEAEYIKEGMSQLDPNRMFTGASNHTFKLPAHCLVRGEVTRHKGADGKDYALRFELRLPDEWANKFIFQGGGGTDGFLANAIGTIPLYGATELPALARGFAVVSMNGGHDGLDASFGLDQQARLDYAYAAIGKVTDTAKRLIQAYYQKAPQHSFFMGCSNGGREAMMAAQRYPTQFDGVVAANPGFHLSRAGVSEAWDTKQLMKIAPKDQNGKKVLANALSDQDLNLLSDAVLKKCDAIDGLKDGIINDYLACDFKPEEIQCKAGDTKNCLSAKKVQTIKAVFSGPKDSQGNDLYSDWPYDAGVNAMGWRMWKLGSSQDADKPDALNATLGLNSLQFYFMTPPNMEVNPSNFDFDKDVVKTNETGAINDATSTMLSTFKARGGKLIVIQGVSDPVFSANDIKRWYENTSKHTDGDMNKTREWGRLFMVPGMTHCGGGPALDDIDPLTAIDNWVTKNQAPAYLPAKGGQAFPEKSQPICPFPQVAKYNGKGDANNINSFHCE